MMNWEEAVKVMAQGRHHNKRDQAAGVIFRELERDDNGTWEWILDGDWEGNETLAQVREELAAVEDEMPDDE